VTPRLHLFQPAFPARLWTLLQAASVGLYSDGCLGIAKGAAYSGLLSFFPVLTTLAALLVQAKAESVSRTIAHLLYDVVPPGTEDVVRTLFVVHGQRPAWLLVTAAVLALWAASGAMMSLMEGFRAVYRIPEGRSFLRERGMAILLSFTSALPVLGASALIVFGRRGERAFIGWLGMSSESSGWVLLAGQVLRFVVATGAIVLAMALIYDWGPNRRQSFRQVIPGAILATFLWLLATLGFGLYVHDVANYNVLYGSVGAGLALLVWMYVLSVIILLGCEFNAARENALAAVPVGADPERELQ
jgi:membrane protein